MCEINSKGPDPPRSPQGYSLPKRTQGGGPALGFYLIHSHSNFRSGPLILSLEGWAFEFCLCPTWGLVPILFSDVSPFQFRSNLHLWLDRKKQQPWLMKLMKSPAKLASNSKVHEVYFVEHCCHVYQTHRYTFPHLETLLFLNFQVKICQDMSRYWIWHWNWFQKKLPNPGNQHLTLSNLCSWSLEGKPENNICIR